ncbi:uncharacterized protein SPAPADRAFT_143307 [Spathaspora passalidarum NRRL Y-27907]|uniref:Aurora kinase n=1 Tax=Spathaspora passalidarum (strain NRRL Y-27907 / 11-Y1) TaxID=619300 RepID=G3AU88_SPAPN|nr:uncharacterized protein SPAPADRAFT_143307 [Spathaspora passalidarum NRRL Y-27907]EGW30465.1 hypothetical protein SPAPADRAFT_143307 [Spathaspora passalidarum NRRL Y-27907]
MSNSTTSSTPLSSPFVESPGSEKRFTLDDFEFGKILGKGKLGRVYCVKHKESGLVVALKAMNKQELIDLRLEKNFRREIEIQSKLHHPNITRLYTWFHDHVNVYLVLEFSLYGELYHHLKQAKRFDNALASYYIYQVTQALIYLHRKNIIHRDLKPENIMLSLDNVIKLSDFGWSVQQHQDKPHYQSNPTRRITLCGTLDYLPPEMVESKPHDKSVDIWALGILTYEFLVGKPPFEEASKDATHQRISKGDIRFPNYVDHDAVDLIRKLLHKVPEKRLSLKSVLNHRWIMKHKPNWPTKK